MSENVTYKYSISLTTSINFWSKMLEFNLSSILLEVERSFTSDENIEKIKNF